jgi:hypothetical protein
VEVIQQIELIPLPGRVARPTSHFASAGSVECNEFAEFTAQSSDGDFILQAPEHNFLNRVIVAQSKESSSFLRPLVGFRYTE